MLKIALLAAAAVIGIAASAASAGQHPPARAGLTMLWNQNSADSNNVNSQNYTSGGYTDYDSAGADDFVVPGGQTWKIEEVDVSGIDSYYPLSSFDITFYQNKAGKHGGIDTPGKAVKHAAYTGVSCSFSGNGNYACVLPGGGVKGTKYPKFKAGHYWVSFVANGNYLFGWSWSETSTITGDAAEWENPGGGWGTSCATWNTIANCTGTAGDLAFDLQGTSR